MRCLVTGAAGFIGSTLSEKLLSLGHEVVGVDCFIPYYARELKESNLAAARDHERFTFHEQNVVDALASEGDVAVALLDGVDVIFHQAAQAGVRKSWGRDFETYTTNNILATQVLLEAARTRPGIKVVYASSSSVYGETAKFPSCEEDLPAPVSPYGVSKLAAEHLMRLYHHNYGLHTVSLRYFTVYGPRQRPDMAFHRLCAAVLRGDEFVVFGNGEQSRDFTFIDDIVQANIDSATLGAPGGVYNLGGGTRISMNDVIKMVGEIAGKTPRIRYIERQMGDVSHTGASTERAQKDLHFQPRVTLREGLAREIEYLDRVVLPLTSTRA